MLHVFEWIGSHNRNVVPWMVLGKGPTFALRNRVDLSQYTTVALNHAVSAQSVDIAHAIDISVIEDCSGVLEENAKWLLMPLYPHVDCKYSGLSITDFFESLPVLKRFDDAGRLLWYDLVSAPNNHSRPVVRGVFSAAVVIELLGQLGVKRVKTLGVDGGNSYSGCFDTKDLLLNEIPTFDVQFKQIDQSVEDYDMSVSKAIDPIRIFVGCDDSQLVAGKVLEHSIKQHTEHPVEVLFMNNMPVAPPVHEKNRPGTGFSFNRFLIPKLAGYRGRAIYLDADMLVLDDIEKLWNTPMGECKVLCSVQEEVPRGWEDGKNNNLGEGRYWTPGRQMSVMLMDCGRLDWDVNEVIRGLDEGRYSYKELMAEFCILNEADVGDNIPNTWNCLEWFEEGQSQLVHFTVVPTQPWKNDRNALEKLWLSAFRAAYCAGAVPLELIRESVDRRWIKPSLLSMAEACEVLAAPACEEREVDEATRLRRMLWDAMISDHANSVERQRLASSLGWRIENTLIRRPWKLASSSARYIGRKMKCLLNL